LANVYSQRKLVERVTAAAVQLRQTIAAEVEALILGTKPLPRS
jgi:hypothetical protein